MVGRKARVMMASRWRAVNPPTLLTSNPAHGNDFTTDNARSLEYGNKKSYQNQE